MPYCTFEDIRAEIGEIDIVKYTDDTDSDSLDTTNLDKCIAWADSSIIDSTLRKVFTVPFDPVPPEIKTVSTDLAIYKLAERRGKEAKQQHRYDRAMAKLKALRSGADVLVVPDTEEPPKTVIQTKSATIRGNVFSSSVLHGM